MNLKHEEKISGLNVENEFLMNAIISLENGNKRLKMDFESSEKSLHLLGKENERLKFFLIFAKRKVIEWATK